MTSKGAPPAQLALWPSPGPDTPAESANPALPRSPERLADVAWQLARGETGDLCYLVARAGGSWRMYGDDVTVTRADGLVVGLAATDPATAAVLVCFAVFGERWAEEPAARELRALVNRQWDAQRRAGSRRGRR